MPADFLAAVRPINYPVTAPAGLPAFPTCKEYAIKPLSFSLSRLHSHADVAGAATSVVCLVHCLLTPVALSLFPGVVSCLPGDATVHRLLTVTILLFGVAGFVPGYRLHRRKGLLPLIGAGIALIVTVAWAGESLNGAAEVALSVTGSVLLVTAHLLNRSFCRQCRACRESGDACGSTNVA